MCDRLAERLSTGADVIRTALQPFVHSYQRVIHRISVIHRKAGVIGTDVCASRRD